MEGKKRKTEKKTGEKKKKEKWQKGWRNTTAKGRI